MRAVRGIAAAIVVPTLVLAGCSDEQASKAGAGASSTTSAEADEPGATAPTPSEGSGRVAISDAGDEVAFRCAGTGRAGDLAGGRR